MLHYILHVNACDVRAVNLDPLFGEAGVVNIADVQMNSNPRALYFIEERGELAWTEQKSLFGVAVFYADFNASFSCDLRQLMKRLNRALIDFVVRRFFRYQAGDDQDRIGPETL